jgi:NadR type nicotinamide-nucleotide adenylyltransferase
LNLISITGPECTGKSSLANALADHYKVRWVKEYSREYLATINRPYQFEDIVKIARGQYHQEQELTAREDKFLLCDTDMLVCKIWSQFKYGKVDPWLESMTRGHLYDLYLLCDIDLPWAEDPLREHPFRRKELFDMYIYELKKLGVSFEVVSGLGYDRVMKAISIIDRTFTNQPATE